MMRTTNLINPTVLPLFNPQTNVLHVQMASRSFRNTRLARGSYVTEPAARHGHHAFLDEKKGLAIRQPMIEIDNSLFN